MKSKQGFLLSFFLVSVSLGVIWFLQGNLGVQHHPEQSEAQFFQWQAGASQRYRVKMDSSMRLKLPGANTTQNIKVSIRTLLDLVTLAADKKTASVGMRLSDVQVIISGQSDPEMNRMLERPFRVQFTKGGVAHNFEFSEGLTGQEQSMLENIVRTFTVSIPEQTNQVQKKSWVAKEKNASGEYLASYQRISPTELEKSKANFNSASASPMLDNASITSKETIQLNNTRNWLSSMTVDETIESPGKFGPDLLIINHAKIDFVSSNLAALPKNYWHFIAAAAQAISLKPSATITKLSPQEARHKLLQQLPALNDAIEARTRHIHEIRDLLRADASMPAMLLEQMKTQDLSDRTRADLYLALELAATEEAQAALTQVMTSPDWSTRDALRATVALAGISNPSSDTLQILWDTAYTQRQQISNTATYTLGSIGSRMKAANHPDYFNLRNELISGASDTSNTQQSATFIYALGNTRDPEVVQNVSPFLDNEQPEIRRAAASSLGLMSSQQSADALVSRFDQESDSQVRGAMAKSLSQLPLSDTSKIMASVSQAIQTETDESARFAMADFMGKNLAENPEYKTVLQNLARTEPSKRVRQVIGNALAITDP